MATRARASVAHVLLEKSVCLNLNLGIFQGPQAEPSLGALVSADKCNLARSCRQICSHQLRQTILTHALSCHTAEWAAADLETHKLVASGTVARSPGRSETPPKHPATTLASRILAGLQERGTLHVPEEKEEEKNEEKKPATLQHIYY